MVRVGGREGGACWVEEEGGEPPGCVSSCLGGGGGCVEGGVLVALWVQIFRGGERVAQGVWVKHSGVKSGETLLAC